MTSSDLDWKISPEKLSDAELERHLKSTLAASLRRGARVGLPDFARYVFGLRPAEHHLLWLDALEGVERGEISKLLLIAPPGHAKSTYTSIVFPTWYIGRNYRESVLAVTTTGDLARLYGDTVRTVIEDGESFSAVFPGVVPDRRRGWGQDGFFVKGPLKRRKEQKDAAMVYTGAGGSIIGRRADGVIIDDAVDEPIARSETLLTARKLWINRTIYSRLQGSDKGWRVVAGTLWTEDDVVDSTMRAGESVVVHMAARSPGSVVSADVWIPRGVGWRPKSHYDALD